VVLSFKRFLATAIIENVEKGGHPPSAAVKITLTPGPSPSMRARGE